MRLVEELKQQVKHLDEGHLRVFANWFDEYLDELADQTLAERVAAGEFDELAKEAIAEDEAGETLPL
jgi:hypothetical protein